MLRIASLTLCLGMLFLAEVKAQDNDSLSEITQRSIPLPAYQAEAAEFANGLAAKLPLPSLGPTTNQRCNECGSHTTCNPPCFMEIPVQWNVRGFAPRYFPRF